MKKTSLILCLCVIIPLLAKGSNSQVVIKANSNAISYTGRVQMLIDGSVRYDWTGVYFQTYFSGGSIAVKMSQKGKSYQNLFIDNKLVRKINFSGKDTVMTLVSGLSKGFHLLRLQKCTEGGSGAITIHSLVLSSHGTLKAVPKKSRMIEIFGDSYTCGYGSEAKSAKEHFKLETENCDKAYGCIIARYFDADYALIAHSGQGMVRNWNDSVHLSKNTMQNRMMHVYDDYDQTLNYDFKAYKPDIVLINLGTNDFSRLAYPNDGEYIKGYKNMIKVLREKYGDVPILAVAPHSCRINMMRCLLQLQSDMVEDKNFYLTNSMNNIVTTEYDTGADGHPNYSGHCKIAMTLIPKISAILGWPLEDRVIK